MYILVLLSGCLHTAALRAQEYRFEQLGTQQGLPSSEVYGLHMDRKGYLWAFTGYGMVKHNGERFVKTCSNISFHQSVIYAKYEDEKGNFFVANSKAQILRIRNDSAFIIPGLEELSEEIIKYGGVIYGFSVDDTSIAVSTNVNSYLVRLGQKRPFVTLGTRHSTDTLVVLQRSAGCYMNCNVVTSFGEQKNEGKQNLDLLFIHTGSRQHLKITVPDLHPTRHYIERQGTMIYLMFSRELFLIDTKTETVRSIPTSKQILNYSIDESGNIWICFYKGGVAMYDKNGLFKKSYFETFTITDIQHDLLNGIWLSSLEKGIFYCANKYEIHYDLVPSIGTENITCLKACDSSLFVGTMPGSITIFHKQVSSFALVNTGFENNEVLDVMPYRDAYLIGTKNGMYRLSEGKFSRLTPIHAACNQIFQGGDSILYLTNHTVEHVKLRPFNQYDTETLKVCLTCGIYRPPATMLLGTTKGLYTYDLSTREFLNHGLPENIIRKLYTDPLNNVWVCTKGDGLYRISPAGDTLHISNLPTAFINDIRIRNDSLVFISTNTGLYYTLLKEIHQPSWINFYTNETLDMAFFNDKLFAGTKSGLVSFEETVLFDDLQPGFYLREISVNEKPIGSKDRLHLLHYENSIRFDFDYLNFNAYKQLSYELNGPLNTSGLSMQTELSFQNLPPGTYSLSVWPHTKTRGRPPGYSCTFTILPALWQTTGFYIGIALATILFTALVVFFITKTREQKRKKVFEIEKQLAEQKLTALKAQINPHFISNSLSAIQQLIHTEEIDKAGKYIAMFSVFIRRVLNLSDKVLVPLDEELKVIDLYIELEQLRFANKFSFIKKISPGIDVYYTAVPPLITQPLIENAIWHGLLQLKRIRQPVLSLSVYIQEGNVVIEIEDNGIGRDACKEVTGLKESKGTHLVKSRIENLNKIHKNLNASVLIHDLIDQNGMPAGTKVVLTINSTI